MDVQVFGSAAVTVVSVGYMFSHWHKAELVVQLIQTLELCKLDKTTDA